MEIINSNEDAKNKYFAMNTLYKMNVNAKYEQNDDIFSLSAGDIDEFWISPRVDYRYNKLCFEIFASYKNIIVDNLNLLYDNCILDTTVNAENQMLISHYFPKLAKRDKYLKRIEVKAKWSSSTHQYYPKKAQMNIICAKMIYKKIDLSKI